MWSLKKDILSIAHNNNLPFLSLFDARGYKQTFKDSEFQKDLSKLKTWTQAGKHGDMSFLELNHEARQDLSLILPNVKSVLMFLVPYALPKRLRRVKNFEGSQLDFKHVKKESLLDKALIAKYAHAKDYHKVLKKRMMAFSQNMIKHIGREVEFRPVVDSVPFFERAHAREVGLGFIGKNTMLIKPGLGSYFFIASLFLSIEPEFIASKSNKANPLHALDCGQCQKCLHACPTGAIESPYSLNAKKCLSYMTIEHRGQVDEKYLTYFSDTIFGCDICQDVCPYNLVANYFDIIDDFKEKNKYLMKITARDVATMKYDDYKKWFGGTALTRAKYGGLIRNALYHLFAIKDKELESILIMLANHEVKLVRDIVKQLKGT